MRNHVLFYPPDYSVHEQICINVDIHNETSVLI